MNNVCLIGRLGRDPDTRQTPNGKTVGKFSIAVDEGYGENKRTHWFDITTWGRVAENCAKYISKGSKVAIAGRLQQDRWQTQEGDNRSKVVVVAFNVEFLDPPSANANSGSGGGGQHASPPPATDTWGQPEPSGQQSTGNKVSSDGLVEKFGGKEDDSIPF